MRKTTITELARELQLSTSPISRVIPNFLPLAIEESSDFHLMTFGLGDPLFVLKFKNFIPFGFINQVICAFGVFPEEKRFWRDQLLFTLEGNVKILIKIDFRVLEIKVYANFFQSVENYQKNEYIRYIFYGLLTIYWDMEMLDFQSYGKFVMDKLDVDGFDRLDPVNKKIFDAKNLYENERCRPLDLHISLDDKRFISFVELCSLDKEVQINAYRIYERRELSPLSKPVPVYPYQPFTVNELQKPKKAVISYSKKDVKLVQKFKQYLIPLSDDGPLEDPWHCTELIAGRPWDEVIQQKFDEADIIFFMISENLLSTSYVKEYEIKKAIDKWNATQGVMIVPIILVTYHWARSGPYNLAKFTALPYTSYPITSFPNQNEAWNFVSEAITIMITQEIYPGTERFEASNDMKEFFVKVMNFRTG